MGAAIVMKLLPSLISLLGLIAAQFEPSIHAWMAANPNAAMSLGSLTVIAANLFHSPLQNAPAS